MLLQSGPSSSGLNKFLMTLTANATAMDASLSSRSVHLKFQRLKPKTSFSTLNLSNNQSLIV